MTRLLLLGDASSTHFIKWVVALYHRGFTIGVFSLNCAHEDLKALPITLNCPEVNETSTGAAARKLHYFSAPKRFKAFAESFQPDLIHAHYASSYGMIAARANIQPLIISVWGSDVFEFPQKNFVNRFILQQNFKAAQAICSTGYTMAKEIKRYTSSPVHVIPFGVDTTLFQAQPTEAPFTFGAVKALEKIYGMDTIIRAFARVHQQLPTTRLELIGNGSERDHLHQLALGLNVQDHIVFHGKIPNTQLPLYLNRWKVFINASRVNESFGVSIVEAMACELPIIITDTPGPQEVSPPNECSVMVPIDDTEAMAREMIELYHNHEKRRTLALNGRKRVLEHYDWNTNVQQLIDTVYTPLLKH